MENNTMEIDHNKQEPNLDKLRQFIQFHDIDPNTIWNEDDSISPFTFIEKMEKYWGYTLSIEQINLILTICQKYQTGLKIQYLWAYRIWPSIEISNRNQIFHQVSKNKISCLKRPKTALRKHTKISDTFNLKQSQISYMKENCISSVSVSRGLSNSRNIRQKKIQKSLEDQINKNSLDKKWQYLIKVGEMNSWMKKKNELTENSQKILDSSQQCFKESDGQQFYSIENQEYGLRIVCKNHKNNGSQQTLPLKVFDQRYQAQRKKNVPMEKFKNNMKGTVMMVLGNNQKFTKAKLHEKISQRDQQLNYILLEIMRTKSVLEQQQATLNQCKINIQ